MFQNNIRNKLILLLLVVTVIPFGASIFFTYYYTSEALKERSIIENVNLLNQGKINLENYLSELSSLTKVIYNNTDITRYIQSKSKEDNYVTVLNVKSLMSTLLYTDEDIVQVALFSPHDQYLTYVTRKSSVVIKKDINFEEGSYAKALQSKNNLYIEPLHRMRKNNNLQDHSINDQMVISFYHALKNVPSDNLLGYFTIDIKPNKIMEMSRGLYHKDLEEFYILSPTGEMIYSSKSNEDQLNWRRDDWYSEMVQSDKNLGYLEINQKDFKGVVIYDRVSEAYGGWLLVKRIPYQILFEGAREVTKINIFIGIGVLVLVIVSTLFVSFKITSPIRVLLRNIQRVEDGKLAVDFESLGEDEIGLLGKRFKSMVEKLDNLIIKQYKLDIENKNNQLKVLQSQINPHFLYNTLQSIGTLALRNKVPQIYSLITLLSNLMRYGIQSSEDMVPLTKEIKHAKAYLELQKQRFEHRFEYEFFVDDFLQFAQVPKMILQPLIENYFQHGFEGQDRVGKMEIYCLGNKSNIEITIKDNGAGVNEERLQLIRHHLKEDLNIMDDSIGLKNVARRIKLYYGEDNTKFSVDTLEGGGFIVQMVIPIVGEEGLTG